MPETSQDPAATVVYLDNWTARLARMTNTPTISSATVTGAVTRPTGASGTVTITQVTNTTTGVLFKMAFSAISPAGVPSVVTTTTTATLSDGQVDVAHHEIQVTAT